MNTSTPGTTIRTRDIQDEGPRGSSLTDLPSPPAGRTGWPWTTEAVPPAQLPPPGTWPRISIVIPSFNQGRYIEETLRSILLQGYPELEVIVIDGGSNDETVSILQKYEPFLTYWVSEPDRGQTHAINKGLERATGEIFAYLNSDDLYLPSALAAAAAAFAASPEVDAVHGKCVYIKDTGEERFTIQGRVEGFEDYLRIWERLARREFLTQPEVFCRTRALKDAGGFREELRSVMDLEMWLRLLSRGSRFLAIDAPIAKFRTYAAQKSSMDPGDELCGVIEEYIRESGRIDPREQRQLLDELEAARGHLLVRAAIAANMLDRYTVAVGLCLRGAVANPRMMMTYPFWAVLARPLRKRVPVRYRSAIQRLFREPSE
jgi:glycosyltransferase involved in cell wall biosynthesis